MPEDKEQYKVIDHQDDCEGSADTSLDWITVALVIWLIYMLTSVLPEIWENSHLYE